MEVLVEEFVRVHPSMKKILPSVDNESIGHPTEMRMQLGERSGLTGRRGVVRRGYPTSITNM